MARRKAREAVPLRSVTELLECLAGSYRLEVLTELLNGRQDVSSLANRLELGITDVSKCLRRLHQASLVDVAQEGNRRFYRPSANVAAERRRRTVHLAARTMHGEIVTCHARLPLFGGGQGRLGGIVPELAALDPAIVERIVRAHDRTDRDPRTP